eukprot:6467234-Amphidinium_carterae.1
MATGQCACSILQFARRSTHRGGLLETDVLLFAIGSYPRFAQPSWVGGVKAVMAFVPRALSAPKNVRLPQAMVATSQK